MSFIYNMADTWNNAGTTFNAIYMNISDGAGGAPVGAAASRAFRLDKNGTNIFDVDINGAVTSLGTAILANGGIKITSSQIINWAGGCYAWNLQNDFSGVNDLFLYRDAANILAQRNGTNAQELRIYNTFTDASNYERGYVGWITDSSIFEIGTQAAGSGSARDIQIRPGTGKKLYLGGNNASQWFMDGTGLLAQVDNTYDIGASGATRPRNVYNGGFIKTAVVTLASLSASIATAAAAGNGARAYITDITTATRVLGTTAAGGGTLGAPVYSDGTQWISG